MAELEQEMKGEWKTVCPYCEEEITGDTKEEVVEKEGLHRAEHFDGQDQDSKGYTDSELSTGRNILDEYSLVVGGGAELDIDSEVTYYLSSRTGVLHKPKTGSSGRVLCGSNKENMEKVEDVKRLNPAMVRKCGRCFSEEDDTE